MGGCSVRLQVKCIEFSLALLYIVLVSLFFGWGLFRRTSERRTLASTTKPLLKVTDEGETDTIDHQNGDTLKVRCIYISVFVF